jgi:hypothetical protein
LACRDPGRFIDDPAGCTGTAFAVRLEWVPVPRDVVAPGLGRRRADLLPRYGRRPLLLLVHGRGHRVAAEVGLVVLIHNDVDRPFAKKGDTDLLQRHPRIRSSGPTQGWDLFGTDTVAPKEAAAYYAAYEMYQPLWQLLTPGAKEGTLKKNYERIFDEGRRNARAWEKAHPAGRG